MDSRGHVVLALANPSSTWHAPLGEIDAERDEREPFCCVLPRAYISLRWRTVPSTERLCDHDVAVL